MESRGSSELEALLERGSSFLTRRQCRGAWREAFGDAADRLPEPYALFAFDEDRVVTSGFPILVSPEWDALTRRVAQLIRGEVAYRVALLLRRAYPKQSLVEERRGMAAELAEIFENAIAHDHGRKFPEMFWLIWIRECAAGVTAAVDRVRSELDGQPPGIVEQVRLAVGERLAEVSARAEGEALRRLRRNDVLDVEVGSAALSSLIRQDVLPLAHSGVGGAFTALDSYLVGRRRLPAERFHRRLEEAADQLARLRSRDPNFESVLAMVEPELDRISPRRLLFQAPVVDLLESWRSPESASLAGDFTQLLRHTGEVLARFEVLSALASVVTPVTVDERGPAARVGGRFVPLAPTTRPLEFTRPGVADVAVTRFGLLYDLVEFTHIFEGLRRQGMKTEERGLRLLRRFNRRIGQIRQRHRLRFEKFLGDGAFYSGRSARAMLTAAAELRVLYERLRRQGFPFDRGMRLAVNVGTYHLVPLFEGSDGPRFEFLGHSLVELARLTTGKTTQEVDDITDFLIASGYDMNRVLEFLEPVRRAPRLPEHVRERPYAAFVAENGELVNQGGVVTEEFLEALESEWPDAPLRRGELYGLSWVLLPLEPDSPHSPWVGLRLLGAARLKGIQATPLAEVVVIEHPPDSSELLEDGLVESLHRLSRSAEEAAFDEPRALPGSVPAVTVESRLCVASFVEDGHSRAWFLGLWEEGLSALTHAYRVPLEDTAPDDDEPVEAWLFRRRAELSTLYQGLKRSTSGATLPLDQLRSRPGFFTCLLAAPHRSPL